MVLSNNPEQKNTQSPSPESPPTERDEEPLPVLTPEIQILYSFVEEYKTRDDQNSRFQKRNFWLTAVTACLLFAYTTITFLQWRTMYQSFRATQHAAVYLGLPDGKVGTIGSAEKEQELRLYFRNYGLIAAQNVAVEVWPVVTTPASRAITKVISSPEEKPAGPSLPPGFPISISRLYSGATKEELNLGQKYLHVFGRVRYTDTFGEYCEPFSIMYDRAAVGFVPLLSLSTCLCEACGDVVRGEIRMMRDGQFDVYVGPGHELPQEGIIQGGKK